MTTPTTNYEYLALFDDWELDYRIAPSRNLAQPVCRADSASDLARCARKAGLTLDQVRNDIPYPKDVIFEKAMTGDYQMDASETLQHLQNVLSEIQRQEREREDQYSRGGDALEALQSRCRAEGLNQAIQEITKLQECHQ